MPTNQCLLVGSVGFIDIACTEASTVTDVYSGDRSSSSLADGAISKFHRRVCAFPGAAEDVTRSARSRLANDMNDEQEKRKADILLNRWEKSLLKATSFSQVRCSSATNGVVSRLF